MVTTRLQSQVTESSPLPVRSRSPGRVRGRSARRSGSNDSVEEGRDRKKFTMVAKKGNPLSIEPLGDRTPVILGNAISGPQTTTYSTGPSTTFQDVGRADPSKDQQEGIHAVQVAEATSASSSVPSERVELRANQLGGMLDVLKTGDANVVDTSSATPLRDLRLRENHKLEISSLIGTGELAKHDGPTSSTEGAGSALALRIAPNQSAEGVHPSPSDLPAVKDALQEPSSLADSERPHERRKARRRLGRASSVKAVEKGMSISKTLHLSRNAMQTTVWQEKRYPTHSQNRSRPRSSLSQYRNGILQRHRRRAQWGGQRFNFVALSTR
jgi:hypothetical protein